MPEHNSKDGQKAVKKKSKQQQQAVQTRCHMCNIPLVQGHYSLKGKSYCERHFKSKFVVKCSGCGQHIEGPNIPVKGEQFYHPECFTCRQCRVIIPADSTYGLRFTAPFCEKCFQARRAATNRPASANAAVWSEDKSASDLHLSARNKLGRNNTIFSKKHTDENSSLHHRESMKKSRSSSSNVYQNLLGESIGGSPSQGAAALEVGADERPVGMMISSGASTDVIQYSTESERISPRSSADSHSSTGLEVCPRTPKASRKPPDIEVVDGSAISGMGEIDKGGIEITKPDKETSVSMNVPVDQGYEDDISQVTPTNSADFDARDVDREREKELRSKDGDDVSISSNDSVDFTLKMFLTENPVAGAARFIGKKISRRYKGSGTGSKYYRHRREDHVMRNFRLDDLSFGPELGQGFFGSVHLCTHKATGEKMAVKEMKASTNKEGCEAFQREVTLLRRLRNPNVLEFYGVFILKDHSMLLITEYISGGTLHRYLKDKSKPLTWDLRLGFLHDIAKGCSYLHLNDVIHRDLTSKNCLIRSDLSVCVADFGLARVAERKPTRMSVVGSPYWMAPEMLHGKQYNHSADVFSFGIIMGEVAARIKAEPDIFPRTNDFGVDYDGLRKLCPPEMPFDFFQLLITCTYLNPSSRPSFAECAMVMDLLGYSITDEEAIVARPNRIMRSYSFDKLGHSKLSQMLGRRVVVTEENESPVKDKSKRKSAAAKAKAERDREKSKEDSSSSRVKDGESLDVPDREKHRSNVDVNHTHGSGVENTTRAGVDESSTPTQQVRTTAIEQRHARGSSVSVCAKRGSPPKPKVSARYAIANASVSKYKQGLAEADKLGVADTREHTAVGIRPNIPTETNTDKDNHSNSTTRESDSEDTKESTSNPKSDIGKLRLKGVAEHAIPTTPSSPLRSRRECQSASINSGVRFSMSNSRTNSTSLVATNEVALPAASGDNNAIVNGEAADVQDLQKAIDTLDDPNRSHGTAGAVDEVMDNCHARDDAGIVPQTVDATEATVNESGDSLQVTDRHTAANNSRSDEDLLKDSLLKDLSIGDLPRKPRRSSEHTRISDVSVPQADVRARAESVRMVWKSDHSQRVSLLQRATNKSTTASHTDESTSSEVCTPSLPDT